MILPTKHILPRNSLLGAGAVLLKLLEQSTTVSALWQKAKGRPEIANYQRYVLALDFLFMVGALNLNDGLLVRNKT